MKKALKLLVLLSLFFCGAWGTQAFAQIKADAIVLDHKIMELAEKYIALLDSMYPEESIKLGAHGYHNSLDPRDKQEEAIKRRTMLAMQETLDNVPYKKLSPSKQVDYFILKSAVNKKLFDIDVVNRVNNDPMWYIEPVDMIYETLMKDYKPAQERFDDAVKRLLEYPKVLESGKANITNPPDLKLRIAMERASSAYNTFNNIGYILDRMARDEYAKARAKTAVNGAKKALKDYFDHLKDIMQKKDYVDFRLGQKNYEALLKNVYMVNDNPVKKILPALEKEVTLTREALLTALNPIIEPAFTEEEKAARTDERGLITITPADYYTAAAYYKTHPEFTDVLNTYLKYYSHANMFFAGKNIFPVNDLKISIMAAPKYLQEKYTPSIYIAPMPLTQNQMAELLVALPEEKDEATVLPRLFTYSKIKVDVLKNMAAGNNLMYAFNTDFLSSIRRSSDDIFFTQGWLKYSMDLAQQSGYLATDEDKLNTAWNNYKAALIAVADIKMQTGLSNYTQSLEDLIEQGIDKDEAAAALDYAAANPAHAIAYFVGSQEISRLKNKYAKKEGKKFVTDDFNKKLLNIGRVPLNALDKALESSYAKTDTDNIFRAISF